MPERTITLKSADLMRVIDALKIAAESAEESLWNAQEVGDTQDAQRCAKERDHYKRIIDAIRDQMRMWGK